MLAKGDFLKPPKEGEIVEGKVIKKESSILYLDLEPFGTGIIYGKEFQEAKEELKKVKIGDTLFAKIIELENEAGYIELSLKEAMKELAWKELEEKKEKGESLKIKVLGANKGGLLTEVGGLIGFLPVSQLSLEHYPQVEDGDPLKVLRELQKFIGKEMEVKILDISPTERKLILSEKGMTKT